MPNLLIQTKLPAKTPRHYSKQSSTLNKTRSMHTRPEEHRTSFFSAAHDHVDHPNNSLLKRGANFVINFVEFPAKEKKIDSKTNQKTCWRMSARRLAFSPPPPRLFYFSSYYSSCTFLYRDNGQDGMFSSTAKLQEQRPEQNQSDRWPCTGEVFLLLHWNLRNSMGTCKGVQFLAQGRLC